ncbi:hypothetical protein BV898_15678 [Hypsibius exemplaris]|uniref:Uncharacterized protein n=1 Tax=Hypsibius exemplaris TaxID=2072580 RepID=A0A9X6RKP4_HYPEX|nr:hypothetical protein BV898_15678 [Hypsibius exemplaris]
MSRDSLANDAECSSNPVPWMLNAGDQCWNLSSEKTVTIQPDCSAPEPALTFSPSKEWHLAYTGTASGLNLLCVEKPSPPPPPPPAIDVHTLHLNSVVTANLQSLLLTVGGHVGLEVASLVVNPREDGENSGGTTVVERFTLDREEIVKEPENPQVEDCTSSTVICETENRIFCNSSCEMSEMPVPVPSVDVLLYHRNEQSDTNYIKFDSDITSRTLLDAIPSLVLVPLDADLEKMTEWYVISRTCGHHVRRRVSLQVLSDSRLKITFNQSTIPAIGIPLPEAMIEIPPSHRFWREKSKRRLTIYHDAARLKLVSRRKSDRDRLLSRLADVSQRGNFF